jgi:nucleotide-binding universal stress UspA family protein
MAMRRTVEALDAGRIPGKERIMFDHILVPLDGSSLAECVLPHAAVFARTFDARLTLLSVLEQNHHAGHAWSIDPLEWHFRKVEAQAYLDAVAARLDDAGVSVGTALLEGQPAQHIIAFIRSHDVELLILSSHGKSGLSDWNISSVGQKIISRAHTSTMIVQAYHPPPDDALDLRYRRLLVPLDGSQRAESVLPTATTLAQASGAELLLVHVVRKPEMPRQIPLSQEALDLEQRITELNRRAAASYLEQLHARLPGDIHIQLLVSDDVAATLHQLVEHEHADLVLLSAHGYSGRAAWPYGSIATSFIAYASTPLLIVQDLALAELEATQVELAAREHGGHA